jgi:DNA-binding response OmpR family regulator
MTCRESPSVPVVLLVDDDALVRWSLAQALTARGFAVLEAGCGAEALAHARARDIDVIVLDWSLPDTNGVSLLPLLVREQPGCRILLLTAYLSEELAARGTSAGAAQVLGKPFEVEDLVGRVAAEALASTRMST